MNSFISRIGGKKLLRKKIISEFPDNYSKTCERYIEVFGGAAWVLLGAEKHAALEVYNDLDGELVNLFKIIKFHLPALIEEIEDLYTINSRGKTHRKGIKSQQRFITVTIAKINNTTILYTKPTFV